MGEIDDTDPCPCGSGKSREDCRCVGAQMLNALARARATTAPQQTPYGNIRPIIHSWFQGRKAVAIGSEIALSSRERPWQTFSDFLCWYLPSKLGREWWRKQEATPGERHPLIELGAARQRHALASLANQQNPGGLVIIEPDGPTLEFLLVAYDLYLVRHHDAYQRRVLHRLRIPEQYHGARTELAAASVFLRAGFDLDVEEDRRSAAKRPEFYARLAGKEGLRIAVEAKRRHRRANDATGKLGLDSLIRSATEQVGDEPSALYLDVHAAPLDPEIGFHPDWLKELSDSLNRLARIDDLPTGRKLDRFSIVFVSNRPLIGGRSAEFQAFTTMPAYAAHPLESDLLELLRRSMAQGHRIPNWFEEIPSNSSRP